MKLSKITHKNELRILVEFPYDAAATAKRRQIPDTRWSQTLKSWHVPYTKEAFAQLKELFPEAEYEKTIPSSKPMIENTSKNDVVIDTSTDASLQNEQLAVIKTTKTNLVLKKIQDSKVISKKSEATLVTTKSVEIRITVTKKRLFLQLQKNDTDTQFLGSFRFVYWDNNNRQWIIPNYGKNLELIKNYFQNRRVEITERHDEQISETKQNIIEADTF